MAFAKPLVLDYGGAATKSLALINQDNGGSEYFLRETTQEFRCIIRHVKESLQANGQRFDRHHVDLTRTVFGTAGAPDVVQQSYLVHRHNYRDDISDAAKLGEALTKLMVLARFEDLGKLLS
jgi:hypothetical protein